MPDQRKTRKMKVPYTQVANHVLENKNLSAKAKGLFSYLYMKPDGWDFAVRRIAEDMTEGKHAIQTGLEELEKEGYLCRKRKNDGRMEYLLQFENVANDSDEQATSQKSANGSKATSQLSQGGKIRTVRKKDIQERKTLPNGNGETSPDESYGNEYVNAVVDHLKDRLGISILDGSQKENRRYGWLCVQKFGADPPAGAEATKRLIDMALQDDFHSKNATNLKYIYYHGLKIIQASQKGGKRKQIMKST